MEIYTTYLSPIGELTVSCDGTHITGLWLQGQAHFAATLSTNAQKADHPLLTQAKQWLDGYFAGQRPGKLPLKPRGTPFQQLVWQLLQDIPYGNTVTYGQLAGIAASRLGRETMSARAIGNAVARNPISILIPCHRVVGKKDLTGYAGGLERKQFLLTLESQRND